MNWRILYWQVQRYVEFKKMSQYYKKYMKKREEEKPSYLKLFIGAFLLMIVFFVIIANHLTSTVDISVGENDEGDTKESGIGVKHLIDSRLRFIKMEDESVSTVPKEKPSDINTYNKTITDEQNKGYSGNLEHSYGYEGTQQTKPYSQTYTTTQKQATEATTAPTPAPKQASSATVPKPKTTPAHNIQKNLTPTGMN